MRGRLGAGGFALVWLAEDEHLADEVAVKVLAENLADRGDLRERFVAEARALRRVRSPHVVSVYDIGELPDGRPFFVMTHADAGSLADRLTTGPLPVADALRVGVELARGVADLHEAGILHRDLKPSNVLFRTGPTGSQTVLVADLGLARELSRGSRITLAAGTPGYVAPEQAAHGPVDERADVYGIAATVYHALTGAEPAGRPAPPSTLRADLPAGVDDVLLRGLAKRPADRWSTAGELGDAFAELTGPAPVRRVRRPTRMRTAVAAVAGALVGAGTAVAVTAIVGDPPRQPVPPSVAGPPGTRAECAVVAGQERYECFLHAGGDTGLLLDFYSHNHEVVLWSRKPDGDTFAYSQRWQLRDVDGGFLVYNEHTDRCLAVDAAAGSGARVLVARCDQTDAGQRWQWAGESLRSGLGTCLDVPRGEYGMGTATATADCDGGASQRWLSRPV